MARPSAYFWGKKYPVRACQLNRVNNSESFYCFQLKYLFPIALIVVFVSWGVVMTLSESWFLFAEWWPMSLTMALGSFVAGSTPAGGGAVAFPVFTKVLQVSALEARTFGLMIQSIGMSMATLYILTRQIPVYGKVILSVVPGGILGLTLGASFVHLPFPYPRIFFTCMVTMFGAAYHISHWLLKHEPDYHTHRWYSHSSWHFALAGLIGGVLASLCGSGIDMVSFIVMTLAYGMHEKKAIPTSVIIMTILSLYGFFWFGVVEGAIDVEWNYWAVCVPIVAVGAPLGALFVSKVGRGWILTGLTLLILTDLVSTILLVEMSARAVIVMLSLFFLSAITFAIMLYWRHEESN